MTNSRSLPSPTQQLGANNLVIPPPSPNSSHPSHSFQP
jgi:hypothetical protein